MKTSLFTGWQARFHAVCLLMLISALAVGAFSSTAQAQAQVTPAPSETVAVEPLPLPPRRPHRPPRLPSLPRPASITATWPGCSPPPCWYC